jgi:hypothetical protein
MTETPAPAVTAPVVPAAAATPALGGGAVLRVDWRPGTDLLRGTCHCGAAAEAADPVQMWHWLADHPRHLRTPAS